MEYPSRAILAHPRSEVWVLGPHDSVPQRRVLARCSRGTARRARPGPDPNHESSVRTDRCNHQQRKGLRACPVPTV